MKRILTLFFTFLFFMSVAQAKDMRFVQVSDARFSGASDNTVFKKAVEDINKQKDVEFVVFTGDNIAKPSAELLESFLDEAKKLKCPFYIVLGDKEVNKLKHLSKAEYIQTIRKNVRKYKPEKPNYVFEKDGIIFAVVDGSKEVIPSTNGYYKEDVLVWLNRELAAHSKNHVIIFQHFPIIPPAEKESYYTFKPEDYMTVLAVHKNVRAVISGHFGVNSEKNVDNVMHITTAGLPYYRIIDLMDYDTPNPTIWAQLKEIQ